MGKDARMNTKQYSSRDIAAHTKLKYRQPGQNSKDDLARRDLKLELEMAERESAAKRRRAAGLLPINEENQANEKQSSTKLLEVGTDEESKAKRRKILEEALLADKDDSESDEDSDDDKRGSKRHGKGKATSVPLSSHDGSDNGRTNGKNNDEESDDDDDDDDDSDDDESETAELLRELEKIKRERAEEKERQVGANQAKLLFFSPRSSSSSSHGFDFRNVNQMPMQL
jgi:protein CWC15